MRYVVDGIANGRILPSHANFSKIDLAAKGVTDQLWSATADVQSIMDTVCETIDPLLGN
jgi:multiple sugar transport system substrate-binding protein